MNVIIQRIYDSSQTGNGARVLVDRLWPRGISKEKAGLDAWLKEVAPSSELRTWFGHDPARWNEFKRRYKKELKDNQSEDMKRLRAMAQEPLILLYGAKDERHNQAIVLKDFLEGEA